MSAPGSAGPASEGPYSLFMLVLSAAALGGLAVATFVPLDPATLAILEIADLAVCVLFFADFCVSLRQAPDRMKYLLRWGWIDLLSCVPMVDALRLGRAARILRLLRVLRGIRSAKVLLEYLLERRAESALLAATLASLLLVVTSSIAILQLETVPEANIKTAEDALWWSIATVTTVGYGDRFPVTTEGRLVATGLMLAGVGVFGVLSGFVAAWFLQPEQREQESEMEKILAEVRGLRAALEAGNAPGGEKAGEDGKENPEKM